MKSKVFIMLIKSLVISLVIQSIGAGIVWASPIEVQFSNEEGVLHFEFSGNQVWNYDLKQNKIGDQYQVDLSIEDSIDKKSIEYLKKFKNDFISEIKVSSSGSDKKTRVSFNLKNKQVETFDYQTDEPSRLVIDFFSPEFKKSLSLNKTKTAKKITLKKEKSSESISNKIEKAMRKPANDAMMISPNGIPLDLNKKDSKKVGLFDGGDPDYDRFNINEFEIKEESIIQSRENFYIEFPNIEVPILTWAKMRQTENLYQIVPKENDENKEARLLWTLFEKKRYAVFIKTLQWFRNKYPESSYNEVIDFIEIDAYLQLWRKNRYTSEFDSMMMKMKKALTKYPKSPASEKASLSLGFLAIEKGDNQMALRLFKDHTENQNFGDSNRFSKVVAKIGIANGLAKMNRFKESIEVLNEVINQNNHRDLKIEATYRLGDIHVAAAKKSYKPEEKIESYKQAIKSYQNAAQLYPESEKEFPGAYFNQAEAFFLLKEYKKSLDVHREFIRKYSSNEFSAYSLTRIGELLEILGADQSKVIGAYMESYFRFGDTPNVVVARLRLLSKKMPTMKPKEIDQALKEINSLVEKSDLENIKQFETIMLAEGFNRRGEPDKSIEYLTSYYQANPTTVDRNLFGKILEKNYTDKIKSHIQKIDFIGALKTHRNYVKAWPMLTNRLDMKYYLGRAFELGNALEEAKKYYSDVLNGVYALRGTEKEKEIKVIESIPSDDHLNLRLAAIANSEGKYKESYKLLRNIKVPEALSDEDQIERVKLAVDLLEKRGDLDTSVRFLSELLKTWKGVPSIVAEPYFKLGELQSRMGKQNEALVAYEKIDELQSDSQNVSSKIHIESLRKMADIYFKKNEMSKSIQCYEKILELYESKVDLDTDRYRLGELYFLQGKIQIASQVWDQFKDNKGFWRKLSQEKLRDSSWSEDYKKYLKRIPAMADSKGDQK